MVILIVRSPITGLQLKTQEFLNAILHDSHQKRKLMVPYFTIAEAV